MNKMLLFFLWGGKYNPSHSPLRGDIFKKQATVLLLTTTALIAKNKFHHLPSSSPILDVSYPWAANLLCLYGKRTTMIWICFPKFLNWSLMANERVFGGGAVRTWLGHEDRVSWMELLPYKTVERSLDPSTMWDHSEKTLSMNQEVGPH